MLIESCCKCGFIHKDERIPYRAYKPHYHWLPPCGEHTYGIYLLHATICVACCGHMDWKEFSDQKNRTEERYRVKWSLNAPLPERLLDWASNLYAEQCKHYLFE